MAAHETQRGTLQPQLANQAALVGHHLTNAARATDAVETAWTTNEGVKMKVRGEMKRGRNDALTTAITATPGIAAL